MSTIRINGNVYSGNNISIVNGKVTVDGKDLTPDSKEINIVVEGDLNVLDVDACNSVEVKGNAGSVQTVSGSVKCGDVSGSVSSISGSVRCGDIGGSVSTISGSIR